MAIHERMRRMRKKLIFLWTIALVSAVLAGPSLSGGFAFGEDDGVVNEDSTYDATATEGEATVTVGEEVVATSGDETATACPALPQAEHFSEQAH